MHIAEQSDDARVVELEGLTLTLRPCAKVVAQLFVAADRRPKDVVRNAIAVEEFNSRPLLNGDDVGTNIKPF